MTRLGAFMLMTACGPGEPDDYDPPDELTATEACEARCDVRATCDPDATDPDADECFAVCMGLLAITEDSECGVAQREFQACIGALDCEGYALATTPDTGEDPCAEVRLAFAELKCGAMEGSP